MDHFKKYWLIYLLLLAGVLFIAFKKHWFGLGLNGAKINSTGTDPNPADCGNAGRTFSREIVCTSPLYKTGKFSQAGSVKEVKERCFTIDQLMGIEPSEGTSIRLPYPYNNVQWHYNRQMGDKYCFVDNTDYPCDQFNCTPS